MADKRVTGYILYRFFGVLCVKRAIYGMFEVLRFHF